MGRYELWGRLGLRLGEWLGRATARPSWGWRASSLALLTAGCSVAMACAATPPPADPMSVDERALPLTPLYFALDPLDDTKVPVSASLRGRRALVLVLASYDIGSLAALRLLGPMLQQLEADESCLLVALEPLTDRELVEQFFLTVPTPCRKAIGDPSRGRLGDLAQVHVLPSVLSLRSDGTLAGVVAGTFGDRDVERIRRASKR